MAYIKIIYQNSPSTATPINAENLNHMDDQIALNDQRLTELEGAHVSSFNGRTGAVTPADGDYNIGQIAPLTGAQVGQVPVVVNVGTEEDPELKFAMGAGGGGGHVIQDASGTDMPQESAMQFPDSFVSDDNVNGRTVVENVKPVASADYSSETEDGMYLITDGEGAVIEPASDDKVEVVADGVKTATTLLSELYAEIDFNKVKDTAYLSISDGTVFALTRRLTNELRFGASHTTGADRVVTLAIRIKELSSDCQFTQNTAQSNGNTIASNNAYQYPNGTVIALHYGNKKATVDLQTTANRCWMSDGETNVESAINNTFKQFTFNDVAISATRGYYDLPISLTADEISRIVFCNATVVASEIDIYQCYWRTTNNGVRVIGKAQTAGTYNVVVTIVFRA